MAQRNLPDCNTKGKIEVAYPLIEKTMSKKWIPNDANFDDQWHLQNTGQTGGNVGEDANITTAWDDYRGNGVVIGIVDDGLDWNHADLDNYYEDTLTTTTVITTVTQAQVTMMVMGLLLRELRRLLVTTLSAFLVPHREQVWQDCC